MGGCTFGQVGFTIRNEANAPVIVWQTFDRGLPTEVARLNAGQMVFIDNVIDQSDECTTGTLIARTAEGAEVASLASPLCNGQTWVISK